MRYDNATYESLDQDIKDLLKQNYVESVLDGKKKFKLTKGIFITGKTGVGKTYVLHAIRKAIIEKMGGDPSNVENWVELLFELREKISKSSLTSTIEKVVDKECIFIDDLGAEKQSDWSQEMLYLIVNKAYDAEKPLFLATNLSIAEFTAKYGERIASRLLETSEMKELTGVDKRIK